MAIILKAIYIFNIIPITIETIIIEMTVFSFICKHINTHIHIYTYTQKLLEALPSPISYYTIGLK